MSGSGMYHRLLSVLAGLVFLWHFGLTFIYVAPHGVFPAQLYPLVTSYMNPGFYQGWSLFAPDVVNWQNELFYRTFSQGQWTNWVATTSLPGISEHPKLEEIPEKLNHNLGAQLRDNLYYEGGKARFDKAIVHREYHFAAYYCWKHHLRLTGQEADSLQMRLDFEFFPSGPGEKARESETFTYPAHSLEYVRTR